MNRWEFGFISACLCFIVMRLIKISFCLKEILDCLK